MQLRLGAAFEVLERLQIPRTLVRETPRHLLYEVIGTIRPRLSTRMNYFTFYVVAWYIMGFHINGIYDCSLQEDCSACQEQSLGLRVFSLTLKDAPEPNTTILCFSSVGKYPTLLLFQSFLKAISRSTPSYTELIFPTSLSLHFQPSILPEKPRSRSSSLTPWNSNLIAWTLMLQRHENQFFCKLPLWLPFAWQTINAFSASGFASPYTIVPFKTEMIPPPSILLLSLTLNLNIKVYHV